MQRASLSRIREAQATFKHLNAFVNHRLSNGESSKYGGPLEGLQIAVKDNICTTDFPTTCGSNALKGYMSPFNATCVARLKEAGCVVVGKTNMDEYGMGSHSTHSHSGIVQSSYKGLSAGGSSGGSAVAVATGQCHAALGTDTGGSVRLPAAYNGIYGFRPSYGRISRWGLVAYANSLDTVGLLANDVPTIKAMFDHLNAYDKQDPTCIPPSTRSRIQGLLNARRPKHGLRFGVPEQSLVEGISPIVRRAWGKTLEYLQRLGHSIHTVSVPNVQEALAAYYVLAPAEASSNLAKYDGVRYGTHADEVAAKSGVLYAATRQQGFGDETKKRILLGAYALSADALNNYFLKVQKIRRLIQRDFDAVFELENALLRGSEAATGDSSEKVDALICPTSIDVPPKLEDIGKQSSLESEAGDVLTVPAALAGLPALNVPVGIDEFQEDAEYAGPDTVGMQVITQYGDDDAALAIGKLLQPLRDLSVDQAHASWLQSLVQPWIERQKTGEGRSS